MTDMVSNMCSGLQDSSICDYPGLIACIILLLSCSHKGRSELTRIDRRTFRILIGLALPSLPVAHRHSYVRRCHSGNCLMQKTPRDEIYTDGTLIYSSHCTVRGVDRVLPFLRFAIHLLVRSMHCTIVSVLPTRSFEPRSVPNRGWRSRPARVPK